MKKPAMPNRGASLDRNIVVMGIGGIIFAILLAGGGTYVVTKNYYQNLLSQVHPFYIQDAPYTLLRPLLGITLPGDQFNTSFPDIRSEVRSAVSAAPAGTVTRYALYFRDLNSGNWTGINENDQFDPASLLKVVVAIAAYRQAEDRPGYLTTPLVYTTELAQVNAQLPFALPSDLHVGKAYSVPFLVERELSDSDNGAVFTLLNSLPDRELESVYQYLSIPKPDSDNSAGYRLTALEYSRFFRILYNGSLNLSWDDSEKILEGLSRSTFTSGLVAGVPATVTVAHKYGEHVDGSGDAVRSVELSDCGIVYYPSHPYFLCVMVEGKDADALARVIAQISGIAYKRVDAINN